LEFFRFIKSERNLRRSDERHMEQSDLTDETLYSRAVNPQKSVEETTFDTLRNEQLRLAIRQLPEVQRRRFLLYHEFGLTYKQIAEMEGCAFQVVAKAVKAAESKFKKYFENQG
jgi:RNA polymerase sigma-70 factor (ECF subfamily)